MRTHSLPFLLLVCLVAFSASAQIPALVVTPSKVTLTPNEPHLFRAVGPDGRMIRGVRWSVSPAYAAELHAGDEAEVSSTSPKTFEVVADYQGSRASAYVTVIGFYKLPEGSTRWSVTELPGYKTVNITPAVPSPGGADIFVEERNGPDRIIRAITEDGRELWRVGSAEGLTPELIAEQSELSLNKKSACDSVKVGSTKKEIAEMKAAIDFANPPLFARNQWDIEERGVTCHIYFDSEGKVIKKRRELTNQ